MAEPSPPASDAWRRFTLLDLLLLVPCFGLGFAAMRWAKETAGQAPEIPPPIGASENLRMPAPWPAEATTLELVVVGLVVGVLLSGPIVLGSHWLFRGRKDGASMGEWLWLGAPMIVLACAAGAVAGTLLGFPHSGSLSLGVLILAALITSSQAFWVVFLASPADRDSVPCAWTDRFGASASLLNWTLVFYVLGLAIVRSGA